MYYTCPCASGRHGYRTVPPRRVMQFVRMADRERALQEYTYVYMNVCARVWGLKIFFRRPLEDQAPFIKCSLEGEGVGGASARCQNFQQFFIPLLLRPKRAGMRWTSAAPDARNAATHTRLRSRRRGRVINGAKVRTRVYFSIRTPSGVNKCRRMMYSAPAKSNKEYPLFTARKGGEVASTGHVRENFVRAI